MSEREINKLDRSMTDVCMRRVKELQQQNAELVAHCEELMCFVDSVVDLTDKMPEHVGNSLGLYACELEEQTPKQSLNQIKADAIEEFLLTYQTGYGNVPRSTLQKYANKLREESK